MKKAYIIPSTEAVKLEAASVLASSMMSINEEEVNTNVQLGRENQGVWDFEW